MQLLDLAGSEQSIRGRSIVLQWTVALESGVLGASDGAIASISSAVASEGMMAAETGEDNYAVAPKAV